MAAASLWRSSLIPSVSLWANLSQSSRSLSVSGMPSLTLARITRLVILRRSARLALAIIRDSRSTSLENSGSSSQLRIVRSVTPASFAASCCVCPSASKSAAFARSVVHSKAEVIRKTFSNYLHLPELPFIPVRHLHVGGLPTN